MTLKPERVNFNETWGRLLKTCREVINLEKVERHEWNDRFSDVYKICVAFPEPLADALYIEIKSFLNGHTKMLHGNILSMVDGTGDSNTLLVTYYNYWCTYKKGVSYLNQLYMYLNTQHIRKVKSRESDLTYGGIDQESQMLEIGELGLFLWRVNIIEQLEESLVSLLLNAIEQDRLGRPTNEAVIHGIILSFVEVEEYKKKGSLDLYRNIFETPFLHATGAYYTSEADKLLHNSTCSQYMDKVLARLDAENVRSRKYLHSTSYERVTAECELRMVAHQLSFLHGECKLMVVQDKRKDLANMYKLLKPIESGLAVLLKEVQDHITKVGLETINSITTPVNSNLTTPGGQVSSGAEVTSSSIAQQFVENVLEVHRKNLELIKEVFASDQAFIGALDKACSTIVNHRKNPKQPCRSPELLSKYCDSLLKRTTGSKVITESEIDDKLSQSIIVFKYIDDKDVFQKFYAKMFAKRLIQIQSISMELEESMINKLKNACGYEFTSKLHRMFTDIKLSDDLNDAFSQWIKNEKNDIGHLSFSIFVLQAGAWPLGQSPLSSFAIPQPFERPVQFFEKFYNNKFNGRKLTWLHHLSNVELVVSMTSSSKKSYIVSMTAYHMSILHLFESTDTLTYKELQDSTKLNEDQLVKHLQGLLDAKLIITDSKSASLPPTTGSSSSSGTSTLDEASPSSPLSPSPSSNNSEVTAVTPTPSTSSSVKSPTSPFLLTNPTPESTFSLNLSFTSKRQKFKITAVAQKEVQQVNTLT